MPQANFQLALKRYPATEANDYEESWGYQVSYRKGGFETKEEALRHAQPFETARDAADGACRQTRLPDPGASDVGAPDAGGRPQPGSISSAWSRLETLRSSSHPSDAVADQSALAV